MSVAFEVDSYQTDVTRVVEEVFRTMLGLEVRPCAAGEMVAPGSLTAAVHFAGEWKGALLMQCSVPQALDFTARLMPGRQPSGVDDDVRDSLGELANMVGGNLKAVLPTGVGLSIPSVVEGNHYVVHICGGNASQAVRFQCDLGVFAVTLVRIAAGGSN